MDGDDVLVNVGEFRIIGHELRIVPFLDGAEINARKCVAVELQPRSTNFGNVVSRNDGPQRHRNVEDRPAFGARELVIAHRGVGCAEIQSLILDPLNAAAGADRLIIDLDSRNTGVGVEPLLVERRGERRAGAGQRFGFPGRGSGDARGRGGDRRGTCCSDRARGTGRCRGW